MIEVELPDGSIAEFPDGTPPEVMKQALQKRFGAPAQQSAPANTGGYQDGAFAAATEGSQSGLMFGFDDEIGAGMMAPIHAGIDYFKGEGFSIPKAYTRLQQQLDARKQSRRQEHPVASIAGEVAGGLATGAGASKAGLTLAGKSLPVVGKIGAAAAEGAAYGGLYGAGEARPGERLGGAATGAAIGAGTGAIMQGVGQGLANRTARKATRAATPALDDIRAAETALFDSAYKSGAVVKPQTTNRLIQNMKLVAGRPNEKLRPDTMGMLDDLLARKGQALDVQGIHEIRQEIQAAMEGARASDVRGLQRMLKVVDSFIDNAKPSDIVGGAAGLKSLREAIDLSARRFKAERIARLIDLADVKTGNYTQSGMMNTLRSEASTLYRQIVDGRVRGFTKAETDAIRQLAATKNSSDLTKWISKFAPRGVVSFMGGTGAMAMIGNSVAGLPGAIVGGAMPAAAGLVAANSADRAALNAATGLLGNISRGGPPQAAVNQMTRFIPAGVAASTGVPRLLEGSRAR